MSSMTALVALMKAAPQRCADEPTVRRLVLSRAASREVEFELPLLRRRFRIARGERIRTEVSYKYRPEAAVAAIERHGLHFEWSAADRDRGFGLLLFRRLASDHR